MKGRQFEEQILAILTDVVSRHPDAAKLTPQPKIQLNDGGYVKPDFDFAYRTPAAWVFELVECQNQKRSRPAIMQKIRYIKTTSPRNRFIFVHKSPIPEATRRALEADGVNVTSLDEFRAYATRIDEMLEAIDIRDRLVDETAVDREEYVHHILGGIIRPTDRSENYPYADYPRMKK